MTGKATQQITGLGLKTQSKFGGVNSMCENPQISAILGGGWFTVHIYHFTKHCMVPPLWK